MLAHLQTAVVVLGPDLMTTHLNPAAEILFSVSARSVVGWPITQWAPGAEDVASRLRASQADGQAWTARELPLVLSGSPQAITVDLSVTPLDDGRLLLEFTGLDRHLRISRDDHRQAQYATTQQLVRGLAHEIKNPLGGVRGAAQLLDRRLTDPALKEFTRVILRESDRLSGMVDAMLGPSRPPGRAPVNLHEVTENVLALTGHEFGARVTLERDYDPSIPDITGDADQLMQALLNLVRNAVQASTDGGRVTVRTRIERQATLAGRRHRQVACVDVIDEGSGIDTVLQDRIFFPLVTTRPEGTGLGLPIAQGLVARQGGLIEFESVPGRTMFTMRLPLESDDG